MLQSIMLGGTGGLLWYAVAYLMVVIGAPV
jgi:hypothetical protein